MKRRQLEKRRRKINQLALGDTDHNRSMANIARMVVQAGDSKSRIIDAFVRVLNETETICQCDYCGVYEDFATCCRHCAHCQSAMNVCTRCYDKLARFSDNVCLACVDELIEQRHKKKRKKGVY
jgi:hypothetical protein